MYDHTDNRGVPVSRGIPTVVRIAVIIGSIAIFVMGYVTIINAGYGHHWPSTKTLRVPLSNDK
jgi:hypothetical protein